MIETYPLYGGKVKLMYDSVKHKYFEGGQEVDGVTTALGKIDKSGQLVWWAVNDVCLPFIFGNETGNVKPGKPKFPGMIHAGKAYDEVFLMNLREEASTKHRTVTKTAAGIGTMIHEWCEKWIKADINKRRKAGTPIIHAGYNDYPPMPVNPQMINGAKAFLEFVKKHHVIFQESENKIFSRLYRYAGTQDFEAIIDGELCIGDLKTSNAIYTTYRYQVSAYQQARFEETGNDYKARWILRVGKEATVDSEGNPAVEFEAVRLDKSEHDEDFKTFLASLQILRREKLLSPKSWGNGY